TNGTPWASDITYIWVDWNMNYEFEGGAELTMLTNVGGTGASFTGAVACPAGQANGEYRMRIRMTYSTAPTPCGNASYGEIEDYTINVGGTPPTAWLTADPLSGTLAPGASTVIDVTFNSNGVPDGDYLGSIVFNSNDLINPVITVPVLFHVGGECPMPAPTNLVATVTSPTTVHLAWEAPETPGGVIRWDDGTNFDGIGLTSGGTFLVAARWTAAQLADYVGLSLTNVDLFPRSTMTSTFTIKIWKGANASTLLHSQLLTGLTMEQWNSVTLSANVVIPAEELWIGYEVGAQPAGDYPAGCDAGPAVANYGDMISLDGTTWAPLSGYGLNYNWNIAGTIGVGYDGLPLAQPIVIGQSNNNSGSSIAKGNLQKAANPNWVSMIRDLMGYNVYRDNSKVNTTIIGVNTLVYNDVNVPAGSHLYYVTAVYPECEAKSNVVEVITDITEIDNAIPTAIYPNPATNFVNIQSGANMGRIMIMNNIGQVVYSTVADSQSIQVNTSDLKKGIYFIQVETIKGMVTEKLIIQ
ncbi:MAG: GEVED domain-containing protein, partial [Bacteroidales bacterium]